MDRIETVRFLVRLTDAAEVTWFLASLVAVIASMIMLVDMRAAWHSARLAYPRTSAEYLLAEQGYERTAVRLTMTVMLLISGIFGLFIESRNPEAWGGALGQPTLIFLKNTFICLGTVAMAALSVNDLKRRKEARRSVRGE